MSEVTIVMPFTPPSLNRAGRNNPLAQHHLKTRLQHDLELYLLNAKLPRPLGAVRASAVLRFPARRRRDEGNYRWLLEKALGDALVNGRWLTDDTPASFRFGELSFDGERGDAQTTLRLEWFF